MLFRSTMKMKWLRYYSEISIIYLVACIFYLHCKLDGLSDYLHMYYQCLHYDTINVTIILSEVKNIVIEIYNEFFTKYNLGDIGSSQSTETQNESTSKISRGYKLLLNRQKKK